MSTSPASKLDLDSLLMIFEIVTRQTPEPRSIFKQRTHPSSSPLNDVRAASQVCRLWRQSLLASPWIWGRIIDLDVLCFGSVKAAGWLDEVVSRAGSLSPLWISGNVIESGRAGISDTHTLFIRLISTGWERIEKLVVVVHTESIDNAIQTSLLTRAPILEVFDVYLLGLEGTERLFEHPLPQSVDEADQGTGGSSRRGELFANYAPALRVAALDSISFEAESSWLPQLLEMSFTPTERFSMNDVWAVIQRVPNLRNLRLDTRLATSSGENLQTRIRLPNLSSLSLITSPSHGAGILNHISTGTLSTVSIRLIDTGMDPLSENIITSYKQTLPVLISEFFRANAVTRLQLIVLASSMTFHDIHDNEDEGIRCQGFELSKFGRMTFDPDGADRMIACLLDTIALASSHSTDNSKPSTTTAAMGGPLAPGPRPGCFESITDLTLDVMDLRGAVLVNLRRALAEFRRVRSVRVPVDSSLRDFYTVLCCPDRASQGDGGGGGDLQGHGDTVLFPELHTVYLLAPETSSNTGGRDAMDVRSLTQIFKHRKEIGFPISQIDMTGCAEFLYQAVRLDFRALEEVEGLEVVWKRQSRDSASSWDEFDDGGICRYKCGSGDPEQLRNLGRNEEEEESDEEDGLEWSTLDLEVVAIMNSM